MQLTPAHRAELVALVAGSTRRARVAITGRSMRPFLRAGMVIDVEPLEGQPCIGDILVFRGQRGLVAHRLVGLATAPAETEGFVYVTCGDAQPGQPELVAPRNIIGRVAAVWTGDDVHARRVDGYLFRQAGTFVARARKARSFVWKVRDYVWFWFAAPARIAPPPAFAALQNATRAFERSDYATGTALLTSVPQVAVVEMARRHHASGFVSQWLDLAARAGCAVPLDLQGAFNRIRWTNALQASRVLARVCDVSYYVRRATGRRSQRSGNSVVLSN